MDRDALLALDKEALVGLILRLQERITELEAEPGRPKGPGNSSVPPSQGFSPNRLSGAKSSADRSGVIWG